MQKKAENSCFTNQKLFNPLTSFFTPWFETYIYNKLHYFNVKKWGKKLVRGVKSFWFVKYEFSAFFCTKNHVTSQYNYGIFFEKNPRSGNNRRHPLKKEVSLTISLDVFRELLRSSKPGTYFTLESVVVIEKSLKSKGGGRGSKQHGVSLPDWFYRWPQRINTRRVCISGN